MSKLEIVFFWATIAAYAAAAAGVIYALVFRNARALPLAYWVIGAGFLLHCGVIVARTAAQGRLPWAGDYENGLLVGWFIVGATLAVAWRERGLRALGVATVPLALLLMGFGYMRNPVLSPLAASLKSPWLYVHVYFAWLAFGAYALAMGGGVIYLLKERDAGAPAPNPAWARFPALVRLDELLFRWIVFGFITDAVMIASGAIWARDLWGSYWSWDPVETWSLVTWLTYGLAIHLRVTRGWRGRRFARVAIAAIVGMIVTFFGVTFVVDTSNHFFNVR